MCVQCLVFSTLTLFMPAPQQAQLAPTTAPQPAYSQVSTTTLAKDTQSAIAAMLAQLPKSSEMGVLREGLNALYAQLATVKDNAEAQSTIDRGLTALSERLKAEPNYDSINEVLMQIMEAEDSQASAKSLGLKMLGRSSGFHLQTRAKTFGWLR